MADFNLPFEPPLPPMEARATNTVPDDGTWQYEPKWDGFRCLVFRDHSSVELQSKSSKSLTRYFPEVVERVLEVRARQFVLDCELLVPQGDDVAFDLLLQRVHPAESRVRKLAEETPAWLVAFDLLARGSRDSLLDTPLAERRVRLEAFFAEYGSEVDGIRLTPATRDTEAARHWLDRLTGIDGIMAKDPTRGYASGSRDAMWKVKRKRTADCVVGGFRYASKGHKVGSLLLGLYDDAGLLDHVGFCSAFSEDDRHRLLEVVEPLVEEPGFTGDRPGGPSRWSTERSTQWEPLRPELVVEVGYDHFTGGRFRHGTSIERWRPEKEPRQCTIDQIAREGRGALRVFRTSS